VLDMVRGVRALGMEACVTLGMLTEDQATRLKQAGLTAYNHNLDTSPEYTVRSSRSEHTTIGYARLPPCAAPGSRCVAAASSEWGKRAGPGRHAAGPGKLRSASRGRADQRPRRVAGTPLADRTPVDTLEFVRMVATARVLMPKSRVRLSAGRSKLGRDAQILCFLAGANSFFYGEKLLVTRNAELDDDLALLAALGLKRVNAPSVAPIC
jgi:biotin synthase